MIEFLVESGTLALVCIMTGIGIGWELARKRTAEAIRHYRERDFERRCPPAPTRPPPPFAVGPVDIDPNDPPPHVSSEAVERLGAAVSHAYRDPGRRPLPPREIIVDGIRYVRALGDDEPPDVHA